MISQDFRNLKWSKIDLQVDFGDNFYIIPGQFDTPVSPVTSKIPENLKIELNQPKNF